MADDQQDNGTYYVVEATTECSATCIINSQGQCTLHG